MFGKKKNGDTSCQPDRRDVEETALKSYSLETIMALQKVLEGGLEKEESPSREKDQRAKHVEAAAPIPSPSLIKRLSNKWLAAVVRKLGYGRQLILPKRKEPKRTSAR